MSHCDRHDAHWQSLKIEHCCSCGATFSGSTAGDKHRVGDHAVSAGPSRRRCLTADEMLARGMTAQENAQGTLIWGTGRALEPRFYASRHGLGLRLDTPEGGCPGTGRTGALSNAN